MQGKKTIIVVDNNIARRQSLETVLSFIGENFVVCDYDELPHTISRHATILTVILSPDQQNRADSVVEQHPQWPFLLHDVETEAFDSAKNVLGHLEQPLNYNQLTKLVHRCHQYHNQLPKSKKSNTQPAFLFRSLVGISTQIQQVRLLIEQVAKTHANVLILGESGTGKEVVARNIHNMSDRKDGPFVPVNCGAIPADLLESELFGHEKGAFTGAISTRKGRFELAEGGTLFLDEIGDMPQPMQVKLLRVLQERTFERIGSTKSINANVRVIAATHQNLETMIEDGKFREDLYYRLNVFPIDTPALRERKDDIPLLLQELISRIEADCGQTVTFTENAIGSLMEHPWAGNVRELSNLVERMIIIYGGQVVDVAELPVKYQHTDASPYVPDYPEEVKEQLERDAINALFADYDDEEDQQDEAAANTMALAGLPNDGLNLKEYLADLEVSLINQSLEKSDWVVARAAELLGMRRTTLVEKMRKYELSRDE